AKGKTAFAMPSAEAKLKSHIATEKIDVTSELKKAIAQSDIVVIAITAKVDDQKKNDYSGLVNTCKQVGAALHQGTLVIYAGISGLGFTEGTIKEYLENTSGLKAGKGFGLAYSPILNTVVPMKNLELRVAATEQTSLNAATAVLKTLTSNVKQVSDIKTAETATLFAVAKQDVATALANELAIFCETANIDYFKVLETLNLNNPDFRPTIAEEENKNETYLLLEDAENLNAKLRLTTLARQINEDMVRHAVNLTHEGLRSCDKTLRRAKVAVLGQVCPESDACLYVRLLEQKGAKVTLYDPTAKKDALKSEGVKTSVNEAVEGADCIVIVTAKEQFNHLNLKKLKALVKSPAVVVDLVGKFERSQVRTEGFKYCGLGRGTDQK
ncbi:MAG TPA: UDP binding domain-containing protein, partial [Candidatus Acidoferrales bacterium]|nr:UDP binding domain-containing protein [Candidatus Acidoferrales bacterium]